MDNNNDIAFKLPLAIVVGTSIIHLIPHFANNNQRASIVESFNTYWRPTRFQRLRDILAIDNVAFNTDMIINNPKRHGYRMLTYNFIHASNLHLICNMRSMMSVGTSLVQMYGASTFGCMFVGCACVTPLVHLGLSYAMFRSGHPIAQRLSHYRDNTVGMSGIIYALDVIACLSSYGASSTPMGWLMHIPMVLLKMGIGHCLFGANNVSLIGHSAGVITGFAAGAGMKLWMKRGIAKATASSSSPSSFFPILIASSLFLYYTRRCDTSSLSSFGYSLIPSTSSFASYRSFCDTVSHRFDRSIPYIPYVAGAIVVVACCGMIGDSKSNGASTHTISSD